MRTNLQVPFAEKDEAKQLGARWDPARRLWYVQNVQDLSAFSRWLPDQATTQEATAIKPTAKARQAESMVKTGSRFFQLDCDCLPWAGCPKCKPKVEAKGWSAPA